MGESVQTFGRKKTAVAVAYCKKGRGLIKINGCPIELVEPEILRYKVFEPILLLGSQRFAGVDIRVRVKGGGHVSQIYAIRQAIAKSLIAYYQKYVDEKEKKDIKDILLAYDRTLLAAASPRSSEVAVPVPVTRSLTVKPSALYWLLQAVLAVAPILETALGNNVGILQV